jgi:hypothetical protein
MRRGHNDSAGRHRIECGVDGSHSGRKRNGGAAFEIADQFLKRGNRRSAFAGVLEWTFSVE